MAMYIQLIPCKRELQVYWSPAASIWFEIWGGRGPGSKNLDFLGKFPKNFDSFRQFHKQKIDFSGQIFEKFRGFFLGNFTKNFDFSSEISEKFRFFSQNI